ncbi:MAG TPA: TRAP transporter substrate-binding protein [Burkholderiaceae bacterium]|nr:TRAP transporter substrate-binding protein [Burkholderiaceae bacterium]
MLKCLPRIAVALLVAASGVAWAQTSPIKLRFAHAHPEADSQHQAALSFARRVKERTNGALEIAIYPSNQLGNDNTMIAGVRGGTIDIEMSGNPFFTGLVPKLNALDLPYQFGSAEQVYKVLDGAVGRALLDELSAHQMKGLAFWEVGFRSLANNRRVVHRAEDIKGLKLRTTPNAAHIKAFQLLGANPQPMPFGEVFPALESGAIDGHENPPTLMLATKMHEVQKHLSLTRHAYTALVVVMNKAKFDGLKPQHQTVLLEEALAAARLQRELNAKGEAAALAQLRAKGMQIVENPDVNAIRALVRDETRRLYVEKNGDAVLKAIEAAH